MSENRVKVDVVIPTCKPDNRLYLILKYLMEQTISVNRIIIINTDSAYLNEENYNEFPNVEFYHIRRNEFDHGATRHWGMELSSGDFVVFLTQDAVPTDEYLIEELMKPFSDENTAVTYGRQLPNEDCREMERFTRQFNYPDHDIVKTKRDIDTMGIKTYFCSDVCAAYRKSTYESLGGFVRKTIFNEDMLFAAKAIQAGNSVVYASGARVLHSHNYSYKQQFERNFDLGVSHRQYKEIFESIKTEDEGIRLVKKTARHLVKTGRWYYIPDLILNSGFKFLGYKMGKCYDRLPLWLVKKCSMNKQYWL